MKFAVILFVACFSYAHGQLPNIFPNVGFPGFGTGAGAAVGAGNNGGFQAPSAVPGFQFPGFDGASLPSMPTNALPVNSAPNAASSSGSKWGLTGFNISGRKGSNVLVDWLDGVRVRTANGTLVVVQPFPPGILVRDLKNNRDSFSMFWPSDKPIFGSMLGSIFG